MAGKPITGWILFCFAACGRSSLPRPRGRMAPGVPLIGRTQPRLRCSFQTAGTGALRRASAVCAVITLLLAAASAAEAAVIRGVVRDQQELPIPGAQVRLSRQANPNLAAPLHSATADSQGRFRFDDVAPGAYELEAFAAGFERKTVSVGAADGAAEVEVRLPVAGLHEGVVVTASRQEEESVQSPIPAALVSDERLQEQVPANLAQALREVPGVNWVNAGAFRSRPVIRGLDSNRILVLVDGERLNNGRTSTVDAGIETSLVGISEIEQVEVVRGPGSVLYGSDALGGVINIRTRRAQPSEGFRLGLRSSASFHPNSDGKRSHLETSLSNRWFSARARGNAGALENYRTPTATVFGSGVDESGALGSLRVYPAPNQSFSFKYVHQGGYNFGLPSLNPNPVFLAEFPFSKLTKFSGGYNGSFQHPLLSSLRARIYTQDQTRSFVSRISAGPSTIFSDTVTDVRSTGFDVQASAAAQGEHVLTYGVSYFEDENRDRRLQLMLGRGPARVLDNAPSVPNSTFSGTGVFLQEQWEPTRRLRLRAGVRWDRFVVEAEPTPNFDPAVSDVVVGSRTDTAVSGNGGASFDLGGGWSVSASLGRAFREPNLFERFFFGRGSVGGFVIPNPGLDPETSLQFDAGVHFRRGPVRTSLNYFLNNLSDLVSRAPATFNGDDTIAGQPISQNVNVAEAQIQGAEATLEFNLRGLGGRWTPLISAAWQQGDNETGDQPLPLIAPFVGQAGLRWSANKLPVWAEGRARLATSSNRVPPGFNPIPGFTVFTWRTGYEVTRSEQGVGALLPRGIASINVFAAMENFTNRTYRGLFETVPQPGRDFRLQINLNLDTTAR